MGEPMSRSPDTVTGWLHAPGFPERRMRRDRRRDRERFLQDGARGLPPSSQARLPYSAGRVVGLLNQPPCNLSEARRDICEPSCFAARKRIRYADDYCVSGRCCGSETPRGLGNGSNRLPLGSFRFWRRWAGRCLETGTRWSGP